MTLFHRPKYSRSVRHGQIHSADAVDRLLRYSGTVVNKAGGRAQSTGDRAIPRIAREFPVEPVINKRAGSRFHGFLASGGHHGQAG
ncbi:hypothetical protein ACH4EC_35710 [Streptomyces anulatus]